MRYSINLAFSVHRGQSCLPLTQILVTATKQKILIFWSAQIIAKTTTMVALHVVSESCVKIYSNLSILLKLWHLRHSMSGILQNLSVLTLQGGGRTISVAMIYCRSPFIKWYINWTQVGSINWKCILWVVVCSDWLMVMMKFKFELSSEACISWWWKHFQRYCPFALRIHR